MSPLKCWLLKQPVGGCFAVLGWLVLMHPVKINKYSTMWLIMHWQNSVVFSTSFLQSPCKWKTFLLILSFGDFLQQLQVLLWRSPKLCSLWAICFLRWQIVSCLSRIQFVKYMWWFSGYWHLGFLFSQMYFLGLCRLYFKCKYTKKAEKMKCLQRH